MIYFVIPVYNEEDNLQNLIREIRTEMLGKDYKIIAVNDGSTDGSLAILRQLKKEDLLIEGSLINMNVGAVFSDGIGRVLQEAKETDVMIIMESDQTSEIRFIKVLLKEILENNNDIAIASRYQLGGRYMNFPLARRIFSHGANYLMKIYFPIPGVRDYTIFFRAYRLGVLKTAVRYFGAYGLIQSKGFVANAELLIKLALLTQRIVEIPFAYNYGRKKGKSKINVLRTINEYFVLITYLKRIFKKMEHFKRTNS